MKEILLEFAIFTCLNSADWVQAELISLYCNVHLTASFNAWDVLTQLMLCTLYSPIKLAIFGRTLNKSLSHIISDITKSSSIAMGGVEGSGGGGG